MHRNLQRSPWNRELFPGLFAVGGRRCGVVDTGLDRHRISVPDIGTDYSAMEGAVNIKDIQKELKVKGFDPGDIDGIWGRRSITAVRAFQKARGLGVDGVVGPETIRALFPPATASSIAVASNSSVPLVWFEQALALVGTKEQSGSGSNERIIQWAKGCNIDYDSDDIPWCGLFVAHCIGSTLPDELLPNSPLGARSWLKFGQPCDPVQGSVVVFWRGNKNGALGHVGFYRSEDTEAYHVLGGNQSDMVNTCRVARDRLLGARWPRTAATFRGETLLAEAIGNMSHNEV